jgi:hypothetical protein
MNSCIQYNIKLDESIKVNCKPGKVYKVKRFRKENIQIPGGLIESLEDIKDILIKTVRYERTFCKTDTKIIEPVSISMINYKFLLTSKFSLDLKKMYDVFNNITIIQKEKNITPVLISSETLDEDILKTDPFVYNIRYEVGYVIVVITFSTPTKDKPNKKIIVRVSYKGKINIQGGMSDRRPTIAIYNFLLKVFRTNQELFIDVPLSDVDYYKKFGEHRNIIPFNVSEFDSADDEIVYDEFYNYNMDKKITDNTEKISNSEIDNSEIDNLMIDQRLKLN